MYDVYRRSSCIMGKKNFNQLSLQPIILDVVQKLKFKYPTDIQEKVIPQVLAGKSVIGQSFTGSGKTHAFLLPLMNKLDSTKHEVQMVITTPTRELARQIFDEVKKIINFANKENEWKARLLIGGTDKQKAIEKLKDPPHIIVGTPGRILDLVDENAVSIYSAKSFVVDEADLMLDMGFIADVDKLLVRTNENIQLLVFSATIPKRLQHFFKKYLKNPSYIQIDDIIPENLEHRLIDLRHRDIVTVILELSKVIQPYLALIFTNGKEQANDLSRQLQSQGLNVGLIHGGLNPRERKRVLKDIQSLRFQYIVATDLASRGIDIEGISHVINAELPKEEDFYIHRVGRTARAGMEGTAISLYNEQDIPLIKKLEESGVSFLYSDVRNGEWKETKPWDERSQRQKKQSTIEKEAWKRVKKPKKVKPGYKKKMKKQQEQIKKELLRKNKQQNHKKRK